MITADFGKSSEPLSESLVLVLILYQSFLNRLAGTYQRDEPPPLQGGIIADPMGLGKTLTMIALVAADRDLGTNSASYNEFSNRTSRGPRATLIIVPPPRKCPGVPFQ